MIIWLYSIILEFMYMYKYDNIKVYIDPVAYWGL